MRRNPQFNTLVVGAKPGTRLVWHVMPDGKVPVRAKSKSILELAGTVESPVQGMTIEDMKAWRRLTAAVLIGLSVDRVLQVNGPKTADALWSAEEILRAGTCGALIFWTQHVQASSRAACISPLNRPRHCL